jgi:hypothetical protein
VFAVRKPRPWSSGWKTLSLLKLAVLATVLWLIVVVPDQCSSVGQASEQSLEAASARRNARAPLILRMKELGILGEGADGRLVVIRPAWTAR